MSYEYMIFGKMPAYNDAKNKTMKCRDHLHHRNCLESEDKINCIEILCLEKDIVLLLSTKFEMLMVSF